MSQQLQKEEQALLFSSSNDNNHAKDDSISSTKKNADDDDDDDDVDQLFPKDKENQNNDNDDDDDDEDNDVVIIAEQHQGTCTYNNNGNFNKKNSNDKDEEFSNGHERNSNGQQHHHNRDVSIETTSSQSIDISLLFNSHHLYQTQQQGQQNQHQQNQNHQEEETISDGNDSPDSGSLSLAVSQVDFSLADDDVDLEGIHMDSDHSNGSKSQNGSKAPVVVMSSSHDLHAMVSVGDQLFRESLLAENEENEKGEKGDHERIINIKRNVVTAVSSNDVADTSSSDDHNISASKKGMTMKRRMMMMIFAGCTIMFGFKSLTRYVDTSAEKTILSFDSDVENNINIAADSNADIDIDIDIDTDTDIDESPKSMICDLEIDDNFQDTVNNYNAQDEETNLFKEKEVDDNKVDYYPIPFYSSKYLDEERTDNKDHENDLLPIITSSLNTTAHNSGIDVPFGYAYPITLLLMICGLWWGLRLLWITQSSSSPSSTHTAHKNDDDNTKTEPMTPKGASSRRSQGNFLTPPSSFENCMVEPMQYMSPCYGDNSMDVSLYDAMKSDELRRLLRHRKCDTTGSKQKLIRKLVTLKQAEFACLTVHQLRPKLRKRNLSQSGNKEQIIRRLVEAGPSEKLNEYK